MNKTNRSVALIFCLTLVAALTVFPIPQAAADHCSKGEGTLRGPAINGRTPGGRVSWQGNSFCQPLQFQVEVRDVNLPDGTVLAVDACPSGSTTNIVGNIRLSGGSGKLFLSKTDGSTSNDNVPFCDMRFGGSVKVLRNGTVVVSGCVSSKDIPGAPSC